jgi:hypothetical protein
MAQPTSWGYRMICGTRAELEDIMEDYDKLCPACL